MELLVVSQLTFSGFARRPPRKIAFVYLFLSLPLYRLYVDRDFFNGTNVSAGRSIGESAVSENPPEDGIQLTVFVALRRYCAVVNFAASASVMFS